MMSYSSAVLMRLESIGCASTSAMLLPAYSHSRWRPHRTESLVGCSAVVERPARIRGASNPPGDAATDHQPAAQNQQDLKHVGSRGIKWTAVSIRFFRSLNSCGEGPKSAN